jgi:hypothetical protein
MPKVVKAYFGKAGQLHGFLESLLEIQEALPCSSATGKNHV